VLLQPPVQIFLSYLLPWSCHRIYAKLQPASDQWGMFKLGKQINPGAFWRDADFHCVWVLTTYIMPTFSNKSVISWPQKHATDASCRKTAATKRGCVSSYHQKKKIHKPKQMWNCNNVSLVTTTERANLVSKGNDAKHQPLNQEHPSKTSHRNKSLENNRGVQDRADSITWAAWSHLESHSVMMQVFTD